MKDPKQAAGAVKPAWSILPWEALERVRRVLASGVAKYGGPLSWRRGEVLASTYFDAAMRHLQAWWREGQERDPETGESHLAHAAASLLVLLDAALEADVFTHDGERPFRVTRDPRQVAGAKAPMQAPDTTGLFARLRGEEPPLRLRRPPEGLYRPVTPGVTPESDPLREMLANITWKPAPSLEPDQGGAPDGLAGLRRPADDDGA